MPLSAIGSVVCERLQGKLFDYYGQNVPNLRTTGSTAYLQWLLSPQNTTGFKKISDDIVGIPGKKRGVAFRVETQFCFNVCAVAADCNTAYNTVTAIDQQIVFDLTNPPFRHCVNGVPIKLQFDEADLERFCTESDQTYISDKIANYLLRFEEAFSAAISAILNAQIGTNGNGEAITNLPIFTASNQFNPNMAALNPEAIWAIEQMYRDLGLDGNFAMIGGTIANKIAQYQKWVTNNPAGLDMSKDQVLQPWMFYDRNFNALFGNKDVIIAAPGAQQLVTWNKYVGEKAREVTNLYSKGTITLPRTGLTADWKWWYDYNCEKWTFEAFVHAELVTVPAGGCGDNMAGVNGIVRVHDCGTQPILPTCPEVVEG